MAEADPNLRSLPLPDKVALVLQGGGALGSFQIGVFEALEERGIALDWVAGISIGAINSALIAGNPPGQRMQALEAFWAETSSSQPSFPLITGEQGREMLHEYSAAVVATTGVPGMFAPRWVPPAFAVPGSDGALSLYDTSPLRRTLDRLVDWDLLNSGPVRLSVGAVEVESGNFCFFDTTETRIDARHIMASGALPPGLPPVEIDGKWWWDGGLVSNTPLTHILDHQDEDMLVFQVDLFPAANPVRPKTITDVVARAKEIQFSSRTRQVTDMMLKLRGEREVIRNVLAKLPAAMKDDPDVMKLDALANERALSLVQLIYRANAWEGGSRDYEFSARTMREHWLAGRAAVAETMTKSSLLARNILDGKTAAFDLVPG
ncbi:patatin-like phospholipase family protein [Sphingomonas sp. BIUV-7]|uniref:Patatin-like phospholipase family protein n=1 Tax=Sphingomonas natans TaxID=3063330 RepID=A0ABT8Y603_9SPHN|nr:patatin-like phospholipase family protein [Sphingomonas sp. BIUV-7]MDO6413427.1 patatin-like phospholipase family protein [Sphingomonas sp. BIUV-7]